MDFNHFLQDFARTAFEFEFEIFRQSLHLCVESINHVLLVFESEYLGIKAALLLGKSLLIKMSRKTIIGQGFTYAGACGPTSTTQVSCCCVTI